MASTSARVTHSTHPDSSHWKMSKHFSHTSRKKVLTLEKLCILSLPDRDCVAGWCLQLVTSSQMVKTFVAAVADATINDATINDATINA